MNLRATIACAAALTFAALPAEAETMRSNVAFNTGIGQKTANQPANGAEVAYRITLEGGKLDGCTIDVVEAMHPRDEGAWGIYEVEGKVGCPDGGFGFGSAGAWDEKGFHSAGDIAEGSGTGRFEGLRGRVAQINGAAEPAESGTYDISYEFVLDTDQG